MIVAVAFWLGSRNKDDDEWVLHSLVVRDQLSQVRTLMQAAETGQRGFLITGRDSYLAPYDDAAAKLPATLDEMEKLVGDDAAQRDAIAALRLIIRDKLAELRTTVDDIKAGRRDAALAMVNSDTGFRLMQQINARLGAMQIEEDQLLTARQTSAARSACCCKSASPSRLC